MRHGRACHIHDAPGQAILLHGNDHVIELTRMHHVVQDISDQAAIYMGRDPSESGNVFRHNFFHDIYNTHRGGHGVQAIFCDDCCTFGATVVGNVFYKTGSTGVIKFNGGGAETEWPWLMAGALVATVPVPCGATAMRERRLLKGADTG